MVALLLAAHLPWVQTRVAAWAVSRLDAGGFRVRTRALTYNLATRSVHVEGLTVSTTADVQHPFLEADRLDVTLPRSVFAGRLAVASLRADRLRVVLVRRQDGSTNFLRDEDSTPGGTSSFPIDALTLSNASVAWRDDVLDMSAVAEALSVNLDRGRGHVALGRPATLRLGRHETAVKAGSRIVWDGATLSFESLRLEAPEATLSANGSVGLRVAGRPLAVDANGTADLDRVAKWFVLGERPLGNVAFRVHAGGSTADPKADVTLTSENLAWQSLTRVSADVAMHIDHNALDTGRFSVRGLGGSAAGRGRLSFAAGGERARAAVEWRNIDATRLLAAVGLKAPAGRVTLAALLDGHATASWTAWSVEGLTGDLEATTRTAPSLPGTSHALALGGTARLATRAGAWRATIDQWIDRAVHVEGRADGRLASASLAASTVNGTVVAAADSPPELWRTLRTFDLVRGAPPLNVPGSARAELTLSGRVDNPGLAGHIDATLPALDRLQADAPPNLKPSGVLKLSATVSGTARAPAIDGRIQGEALAIAGQRADRLDASFGVNAQAARVEPLVLTQAGGRLTVNGLYDLRTSAVTARVTASNLIVRPVPGAEPGQILVPLDGRLSGELQVGGTLTNPQGSGQLTLDDARVLDREIGRVSTSLTLADHQLQAKVALADLLTTGTAEITLEPSPAAAPGASVAGGLSPGRFVVDAQTTDADLGMLASRLHVDVGAPVSGHVSLTAHVEGVGGDIAHAQTTVTLQRLEAVVGDVPVRSTEPGRVSYDGRAVDVAGVTLGIGQDGRSQLRVAGRLGADTPGTLTASLDGQAGDLDQLAMVFAPAGSALAGLQVGGRVRVDARAPGSLDRPALVAEVSVEDGRVAIANQPQATTFTLRASYGDGSLKLSRLDATWQAATLSATGDIPIALVAPNAPAWLAGDARGPRLPGLPAQAPGRLQARFDSVTPAVLAPFVPAETLSQLTGLVSGTLTLDADRPTLSAVRGQLVLDRADVSVAGVAFNQQQPTRVDVADGRARVASWNWGGSGGNLFSVGGNVTFDGTPALDVSLNGTIDLRALGAFIPRVATGGQATLTARVTGPLAAPLLDGRVDLRRGELRMVSPRMVISDLTGSLLFSKDEVRVRDVEGQANGGTLFVGGALKHSGLSLTSGRVAITGRDLAMAIPAALKTEVNLDVTLAADRGALSLSGDVVVLGGAYREPISLTTGFLQALQSSPTTIQLDAPSALDAMALDVRLTTGEDILVDNNYAQLALAADVRIRGTIAAPILLGRAEAREGGRIFLGGNVYQIDGAGTIDFANPTRTEPDLQITAKTRVARRQITMTLKGTPATLDTNLTSDDGLSQGEIVSLLVTGQTQSANAMAVSGDQMIGLFSGEVLGVTGRALRLDALRVERGQDVRFDAGLVASETDPSSRLTFGKQVTRTVEVVFSQSLKDSGALTWIIGYRPKPNVELRLVSQDNEGRIYDFRHDVTIGGDPVAKAAASRPALHVASVRFTGTPDAPERELRDRLKLTDGKEFDFFRWQEDRDRLEERLREDGHFEARVAAKRSGSEAATATTVDLTYEVDRGPRTVVDLVGIPSDRSLHNELARIWSQAVFDGFLLEEARSAARAALVRDGYLSAVVTTSINQPDGAQAKHLVVSVQPGMRYTHRRLVFSGQQHVGAGRLEELAGATVSPWIDPAPLVQAITTMYRNEGFLDAGVSVSPPLLAGDSATLPIVVREGPQFRLESVTFVGPRARTPAAAEKAFGLKPGAPLTRAAADAAVQALVSSYRTDGFNVARVTLTNQATRATGLVALTVTVDEGPRQVLRDITIEGTRRTSPALVSRELKLAVGQPVDLSAWAKARKRLFDTSVFRQVDIQAVPIESPVGGASVEQGVPPVPPVQSVEPAENIQPIRARVTLQEFPPLRIRYGFEVDDQLEPVSEMRTLRPGLAADATYRNVFGRAATTGLALRYTKDFEAARGFFITPSFFGLPLTSSLFLERSREHRDMSTDQPLLVDITGFTAEQKFRAWRQLQMSYSYGFQRGHTVNLRADPTKATDFVLPPTSIGRLRATALVDTRNDLEDATRGLLVSSTLEYAAAALGSDSKFVKYFFQQNYYRTLGRRVVFATSGRLGLGAGFDQDLAGSEKYLAGGGNSVRGYKQDGVGPVDSFFGTPKGGNALLVLNEEIRFPIFWRFHGVGFFDAGNVFPTVSDLGSGGLRAGTGFGLRVVTPFVLLRADLGTPIGARPGERRAQWFFSIGQSF